MRLCNSNHSTYDLSNTKSISSFCLVTDEGVGPHCTKDWVGLHSTKEGVGPHQTNEGLGPYCTEERVGLHSTEEGVELQYIEHLTKWLGSNTHYKAVRSA